MFCTFMMVMMISVWCSKLATCHRAGDASAGFGSSFSDGVSVLPIVAGVIALLVVILVTVAALVVCLRRSTSSKAAAAAAGASASPGTAASSALLSTGQRTSCTSSGIMTAASHQLDKRKTTSNRILVHQPSGDKLTS